MLKEKSVRVESMDEIVFAQRNREYGAYDLRKRYKKNVSKSLIVALIILIFTAGAPFIMALKNRGQKNIIDEILNVYENKSVIELENIRMLEVKNFNRFGGLVPIVNIFGGKSNYLDMVKKIKELLYS